MSDISLPSAMSSSLSVLLDQLSHRRHQLLLRGGAQLATFVGLNHLANGSHRDGNPRSEQIGRFLRSRHRGFVLVGVDDLEGCAWSRALNAFSARDNTKAD